MQNILSSCQNCKKDFTIDTRDQAFYEKIHVPHPTWCPACRFMRRMTTHNVWTVYFRECDKCHKRMLSMYHKDKPIQVYCNECWWADDWDGTEYAMDYDPSRNFFEQLHELSRKTPWVAQEVIAPSMVNSEYCNGASYLRNCYLTFWADYCENINNSSIILELKDSSDCVRARESQLSCQSIGITKCYRTFFSEECEACTDVWFSRNCYNCTDCIGCVNLRGQSYCIFNQKYSKEEYSKKVAELGLDSRDALKNLQKQAHAFWLTQPYRAYTGNSLNLNVTGEYVFESKNSEDLYLCTSTEESRYCQFVTVPSAKECYDYSGWGANAQLMCDAHSSGENVNNIKFSYCAYTESMNVEYSIWTIAGKDNFGCTNLKRKQYCILNKQYSKEKYEQLRAQIIDDMQRNPYTDALGRSYSYGEFLPPMFSLFGYNECSAMKFIPKTKDEALAEGLTWFDAHKSDHAANIEGENLPQKISEVDDSILEKIIGCKTCKRGYKVSALELTLLRKMGIPLFDDCPSCRINALFRRLNPFTLHKRNCQKCNAPITTAFAPDRQETVYCVDCYQKEIS